MARSFNLAIHAKTNVLIVTKLDEDGCVYFENGQSFSEHIALTTEQLDKLCLLGVPDISKYETTD